LAWRYAPKFSIHVCCGQMAGWVKMPFGTEVDLGPGDIVLDGEPGLSPSPSSKNMGEPPNFGSLYGSKQRHGSRCHLVRGKPRSSQHCVTWGPSSPLKGAEQSTIFGPCLLWPNGWMDQDATWSGGRPWTWPHCVRWALPQRGTAALHTALIFDHCLLWSNGLNGSKCQLIGR